MRSLNLLVLRCHNLELSRTFYEIFGYCFIKHAHRGPEHYAHEDEHGVIELYPATNDMPGDRTGLGFQVDDLVGTQKALSDAGFKTEPITDNSWGRTFVARDPDGRRVEVKQG